MGLLAAVSMLSIGAPAQGQCMQWSPVGSPPGGQSYATAVLHASAGDKFYAAMEGEVLQWTGTSWTPSAGDQLDDLVTALCEYDDGTGTALFAAGYFTSLYWTGTPMWHFAKSVSGVWVEQGFGLPSTSTFDTVLAMQVFDDGSGSKLYLGGVFTTIPSLSSNHIVRWDGTSWSGVGGGLPGGVAAMCVYDDGSGPALYASTSSGGVGLLMKWNGTAWSSAGSGFTLSGVGGGPGVRALTVFDDGSGPALFAGGQFTTVNGVVANGLAKWDGANWSALPGVPSTPVNIVMSMTVHDDGNGLALYEYSHSGPDPLFQGLARWDGTNWAGLGGEPTCDVTSFQSFDDGQGGGPALYVAGCFTQVGGNVNATYVARWYGGCLHQIDPLCFGDGTYSSCPCSNYGASLHGCRNSASSQGAQLTYTGSTTPDTLVLASSDEPATSTSLFLQSDALSPTPSTLGDGILCLGGQIRRMYLKAAFGGIAQAPQAGDLSITQRSAALGAPILPGSVRFYQVWYRDPVSSFCPSALSSVSNGLRVVW